MACFIAISVHEGTGLYQFNGTDSVNRRHGQHTVSDSAISKNFAFMISSFASCPIAMVTWGSNLGPCSLLAKPSISLASVSLSTASLAGHSHTEYVLEYSSSLAMLLKGAGVPAVLDAMVQNLLLSSFTVTSLKGR